MTRTKPLSLLLAAAAIALVAAVIAGCGGGGSQATAASGSSGAPGGSSTIGVSDVGGLGKILVDSKGRTAYMFKKDTGPKSTCSGACAMEWPPVTTSGKPSTGSGVSASMVGTTKRSDGSTQVTYNGHPLYRFAQDHKPGDVAGQGLTAFGAQWFAVSGAGNQLTGSPPSSGGSGPAGY